jgi:dimethylglycine dehydrogenase
VAAEYTVTRLDEQRFYLVSTPRGERLNFDLLSRLLPSDGSVVLTNVTLERGCFTIVGPRARELLAPLAETDLSNGVFPWLTARTASVGLATDVRMLRINYEGELGWELYHPICHQRHLLDEILNIGGKLGLELVGLRALESLRLEKSYRAMYRDMNTEYTALESALDRFVRIDKGDFIGRQAVLRQKQAGLVRRSVTLRIETRDASVLMDEGVYLDGRLIGRVSSGGYSYHFGHDLALAFVNTESARPGTTLEVTVLGERRNAAVIADVPYDPANLRCRM